MVMSSISNLKYSTRINYLDLLISGFFFLNLEWARWPSGPWAIYPRHDTALHIGLCQARPACYSSGLPTGGQVLLTSL